MKFVSLFLLVFLFLRFGEASGGMVMQQGIGQASYNAQGKRAAEVEATNKAKVNALNKYVSNFDVAKSNLYDRARPLIEESIDRFVTDYVLLESVADSNNNIFRVVIQATIDAAALDRELSKVSPSGMASNQQNFYLSFVFVAREVKSLKQFDVRRITQYQQESVDTGGTGASVRKVAFKTTGGGSTLKKNDEITWNVSTVNEINTTMNNVFTSEGYEVIDAVDVYDASKGMLDTGKFINDYKTGDDISPITRRNAIAGCRTADLDYLATGTLDIGTGEMVAPNVERVYVAVTGKIWSVKTKFPRVVASVGPVQCAGLGPDHRVAKLNALKAAGEMVARELTSQLRMKGIQ
jgi:hypothetical protein